VTIELKCNTGELGAQATLYGIWRMGHGSWLMDNGYGRIGNWGSGYKMMEEK
jgi:hypothetical protein